MLWGGTAGKQAASPFSFRSRGQLAYPHSGLDLRAGAMCNRGVCFCLKYPTS